MKAIELAAPAKDSGPCVPAALAQILGVSYDQVNTFLIEQRARRRLSTGRLLGGTQMRNIPMVQIGLTKLDKSTHTTPIPVRLEMNDGLVLKTINEKPMTVNQFVKLHPTGSYLVTVREHGLAVVNGVVYDVLGGDSMKKRIEDVWQKTHRCFIDWNKVIVKSTSPVINKKGDKTKVILELLAQGIKDTKVLMARTSASYIYTRRVVCQYNKTQAQ